MSDPLTDIENRRAQQNLGAFGHRVYVGAREDGASKLEAFLILVAYFRGMFGSAHDQEQEPI